MNEIYFEVPISTHETKVCVANGEEELWTFNIVFFESELMDLRSVTIIGDRWDKKEKETQTFSAPMEEYDSNEFDFEFRPTPDVTVTIEVYETRTYRNICVRW